MKNTFPTIRKKVRNKFPYLLKGPNGKTYYMFEANRDLSLRKVLEIEDSFNDEELVFATTLPSDTKGAFIIDAANAYEVGGRKTRPFLFYSSGKLWGSKIESVYDGIDVKIQIVPTGKLSGFTFIPKP